MARLVDLLHGVPGARIVCGPDNLEIRDVRDDSRLVQPGDLFVAILGTKQDGRKYIDQALAKGAAAVLTEAQDVAEVASAGQSGLVLVASARHALGVIAANRFATGTGLTLTAVTGTNGKTTTTYLVEAILAAAGRRPGVIGTVGYRYGGKQKEASLTTPGALELHSMLAEMKMGDATDAVMEASSIALDQGRLAGCSFRVVALTNVTQDHLDYHGTMERYFTAKTILFRELLLPRVGVGVVFADGEYGPAMAREMKRGGAAAGQILTLTRQGHGADVAVIDRQLGSEGIRMRLATPKGIIEIASSLVGDFNVENILTTVGIALGHGIAPAAIAAGVAGVRGVPGRLEAVANEAGVLCVVDYAHTPDALERALDVLRPLTKGRLICVFGCGGDRDTSKRPRMGEAAVARADIAIATSDNPRTEKPEAIIAMILEGARRTGKAERSASELVQGLLGFHVEQDRWTAISRAVALARVGDVVLLAGKGHEDYQVIGTEKIHFDDREIASAAFAVRRGA